MVWVQFGGDTQGHTRHLSRARAWSQLSHDNQSAKYLFPKRWSFLKPVSTCVWKTRYHEEEEHAFSFCGELGQKKLALSFQEEVWVPFVSRVSGSSPMTYLLNRVWQEILTQILYLCPWGGGEWVPVAGTMVHIADVSSFPIPLLASSTASPGSAKSLQRHTAKHVSALFRKHRPFAP